MKKAIVFLADGFEEIEAISIIDILRRASIDVTTVSINMVETVTGAHNITVIADTTIDRAIIDEVDAVILPGGMPGALNLENCEPVREILINLYKQGKLLGAICAAPMVLGGLGLLKGKDATCYPGFEEKLIGANITGQATSKSGNVITGKGPGFATEFALALVTEMRGEGVAEEVAAGMLLA